MNKTKNKSLLSCSRCGSAEVMYVNLSNGELLPSFAIDLATGARTCHPCRKLGVTNARDN